MDYSTRCYEKEDLTVDFSSISVIRLGKSSQLGIFHDRIALLHVKSSIFSQYNMIISPRLAVDANDLWHRGRNSQREPLMAKLGCTHRRLKAYCPTSGFYPSYQNIKLLTISSHRFRLGQAFSWWKGGFVSRALFSHIAAVEFWGDVKINRAKIRAWSYGTVYVRRDKYPK